MVRVEVATDCTWYEQKAPVESQAPLNGMQVQLPVWSGGDADKVRRYHLGHRETWLVRLVHWVVCRLGIIVGGDKTLQQLEESLKKFNIHQLLKTQTVDPKGFLSPKAQGLIIEAFAGLSEGVIDTHLHNLGKDEEDFVPPATGWGSYFVDLVIHFAAGFTQSVGSTEEARRRLQLYAAHFPHLQGHVLPIHPAVTDGKADWNNTYSYLSNSSAEKTAKTFTSENSKLFPAISVHPGSPSWKEELQAAHDKGIRLVKWMPPQSIAPDTQNAFPFYAELKRLGMVLIAHSGPEHAIQSMDGYEDAGNPLRFEMALKMGVDVILAHAGHHDKIPDLENGGELIEGIQLYLRLAKRAEENQWPGTLYADLAGVLAHYGADFVRELLNASQDPAIHLLYGSDYPHTNIVFNDAFVKMAKAGLLPLEKVDPLKEIRAWNPLLANFIFARHLQDGESQFPLEVFTGAFGNLQQKLIGQQQL